MKWITNINWGLIGLYIIYCIYTLATLNSSGMDAAGRGMAGGFALILLIICIILGGLNFIQVKWVRVAVLVVLLLPLINMF